MNSTKGIIGIVALIIIGALGYQWWSNQQAPTVGVPGLENINAQPTGGTEDTNDGETPATTGEVKEFTMTSFYELVDGKPKPQFSVKELTVNKGDTVRIKVTNTKGVHDFKIDEYDVYKMTPANEEVVVEFIADKAGEFVYYCAQPNHRALGHWGTLRVIE